MAHQRDRPLGGILDALNVSAEFRLLHATFERKIDVTLNDGQQIVEIVRYPAREPPHRFHPARLLQLVFQQSSLGDIDDNPFHQRVTLASGNDHRRITHPDDLAVFPLEAVFRLKAFDPKAIFFRCFDDGMVFLRNKANPLLRTL